MAELDEPGIAGGVNGCGASLSAAVGAGRAVGKAPSEAAQVLELAAPELEPDRRLSELEHPITAHLNSLAPSSRQPHGLRRARRAQECWQAQLMSIEEFQVSV